MITCQHTTLYFLAHHSTLCFQITFHIEHVSLLNKWHSAFLAAFYIGAPTQFLWELKRLGEGCTAGWARVTKWCQTRRLTCHIPLACQRSGSQPAGQDPTKGCFATQNDANLPGFPHIFAFFSWNIFSSLLHQFEYKINTHCYVVSK